MKVVFVDVDTQRDFMNEDGALYVPGAEDIKENLGKLTSFAQKKGIPILATVDSHSEDDAEFKEFPKHCVKGTDGQKKIDETTFEDNENNVVFDKKTYNIYDTELGNENFLLELGNHNPDRVIIYGVALEICVAAAAQGLLELSIPITLVSDAVKGIDKDACNETIAEIAKAGDDVKTTAEILNELQ